MIIIRSEVYLSFVGFGGGAFVGGCTLLYFLFHLNQKLMMRTFYLFVSLQDQDPVNLVA